MPFGKRVVNKYGSVCHYYLFSMELYTEQEQMRNIIKKKKCLLFKHEKIIKHYPMTGRLIVTQGYIYLSNI
jgi:hypothetical protein